MYLSKVPRRCICAAQHSRKVQASSRTASRVGDGDPSHIPQNYCPEIAITNVIATEHVHLCQQACSLTSQWLTDSASKACRTQGHPVDLIITCILLRFCVRVKCQQVLVCCLVCCFCLTALLIQLMGDMVFYSNILTWNARSTDTCSTVSGTLSLAERSSKLGSKSLTTATVKLVVHVL